MALRPRLLFLLSFLAIALAANGAFFVMSASAVSTRCAGYTFDGEPLERAVTHVAIAFAYVGRMYVIGRGIESGTAREVALKPTETCRVAAEPLTATDLAHGPIAAVDPLFPVWTVASRDESLPIVVDAAT